MACSRDEWGMMGAGLVIEDLTVAAPGRGTPLTRNLDLQVAIPIPPPLYTPCSSGCDFHCISTSNLTPPLDLQAAPFSHTHSVPHLAPQDATFLAESHED